MRKVSHLIIGVLVSILVSTYAGFDWKLSIFALFGALFPDIDTIYKHRIILHNLPALFAAMGLMTWSGVGWGVIMAFSVGCVSHLLCDELTSHGICPFWPFFKWKMKGPLKTGGIGEKFLVWFLVIITMFYLYITYINT